MMPIYVNTDCSVKTITLIMEIHIHEKTIFPEEMKEARNNRHGWLMMYIRARQYLITYSVMQHAIMYHMGAES